MQSFNDPTKTTRVLFNDPDLPSASYRQAVFIDPGSLEVTGELVQYGSSRALALRTWISEGHRHLRLGEPGRIYSEVATSWLGILSLAGAWLCWIRRRTGKTHSRTANPALGKHRKRQKARSFHSALGIWLLPGFLFLTVTGLTWSLMAGGSIAQLRAELDWTQPSPSTTITETDTEQSEHLEHLEHAHHGAATTHSTVASQADLVQLDRALASAHDAGLEGIIEISIPTGEKEAWLATEMRESWKLSNDAISVDGETGATVDRVDHADWPLAAQLSSWLIQLHMGTLFGWINQLVLGVIVLGLLAYTIVAPMFGISLVAFLAFDAMIQAFRKWQAFQKS